MDYAVAFVGIVLVVATYTLLRRGSTIKYIPGPPSPSWVFGELDLPFFFQLSECRTECDVPGNMLQLFLPEEYGDNEFAWLKSFGAVYRLKGCFGVGPFLCTNFNLSALTIGAQQDRLMVADLAALQHILNSPHFEHGPSQKAGINLLFPEKCVMRAQGKSGLLLLCRQC
jgi:hypothetical protein